MLEKIYLHWLKYKIVLLGASEITFPIEIFSLSRKIADLHSKENAYSLIESFYSHKSAFVRRTMIIAIDYLGKDVTKDFIDRLLESTKDVDTWVRYDAVCALGSSGIADRRIYVGLKEAEEEFFDKDIQELKNIKPESPEEHIKKAAAEYLQEYEEKNSQ